MHSNDDKREWIDPAQGLSDSQVQERIDAGCVNTQDERITKSYEEIFRDNVLTLFNLINAILAGLIIFIGSFKNLLFLGVIASMLCYIMWNTAVKQLGVVCATSYIYVVPLITLLTSAIVINETITIVALLGSALILSGVYIAERGVNLKK